MRRYAWLGIVALSGAIVAGYSLVPSPVVQHVALVVGGVIATAGMATGVAVHRPTVRTPWQLFGLALVCFTFAQVAFAYLHLRVGALPPFPSATDAFMLLYATLAAAGLIVMIRDRLPGRDVESLLDAAVLALAVAVSAWLVLARWFAAAGVSDLAQTSALGYATVSLLLLLLAVRMLLGEDARVTAARLVVLALGAQLAGIVWYFSASLLERYRMGGPVDALLLLAPLLWAAAALHPSMVHLSVPMRARRRSYSAWRLALILVGVVTMPATVGVVALIGGPFPPVSVLIASGVLPLLVVVRTAVAMRPARSIEPELAHGERADASGRLAGGIADDVGNLLTTAMAHVELARPALGDAGGRAHLDAAKEAHERAAALVQRLQAFSRAVPLAEPLPTVEADAAATPAATAGRTILLVDDEASIRAIVSDILVRQGYRVLQAADGFDALTVAENHRGDIDLLITDVVMPRLGGVQLARRIKEARPGVRVLYMSGYSEEWPNLRAIPDAAFLQKPFALQALRAAIAGLLADGAEGR